MIKCSNCQERSDDSCLSFKDGIYIAKDDNGDIYIYENRPTLDDGFWRMPDGDSEIVYCEGVNNALFNVPDLGPWEDSLHQFVDGRLIIYI